MAGGKGQREAGVRFGDKLVGQFSDRGMDRAREIWNAGSRIYSKQCLRLSNFSYL